MTSLQRTRNLKIWPVHDAKARFSEMLETCLNEGPQIVTRRGTEAAILVPMKDWQRLKSSAKPTLKELLLSDSARGVLHVRARGGSHRRSSRER
jgi:prevent-host-death family protein